MSKSGVSKYCSILNYLKHNHEDLYELIQDLCIGRIFNPRKGSDGVTFLCPDKALMAELKKHASGSDPEKAVEMIQSIVIPDHLPSLSDFEGDLPTMVRGKKITVEKSSSSSVELSGGASVSHDKNWDHRKDRTNLAVHTLSGSFPSLTESGASAKNKKRAKKGGADMAGLKRQGLFAAVVSQCCQQSKRDPAMELLVSLLQCLQQHYPALFKCVQSQLSTDTLGTLYIVLQPNGASTTYLSDEVLDRFCAMYHNPEFKQFCYVDEPATLYNKYMNSFKIPDGVNKALNSCHETLMSQASKAALIKQLNSTFAELSKKSTEVRGVEVSAGQLFAEAELRVRSALMKMDYEQYGCLDEGECKLVFSKNLSRPDASQELVNGNNIAYYYSTVYLIARSDALFYMPNLDTGSVLSKDPSLIVNENDVFALMPDKLDEDKLNAPYKWLANLKSQIDKLQ